MDRIAAARGALYVLSVRPRELRLAIQHHETAMMTISCSSFIVYSFKWCAYFPFNHFGKFFLLILDSLQCVINSYILTTKQLILY